MLKITDDIEKSLCKEHAKLFEHTHKLLKLANELSEIKFEPSTTFEKITILFFAKSRKTYWAISTLAGRGFGEDAGILLRSLLENLIDLYWISIEPKERSKRFLDFASFTYREGFKKLEEDKLHKHRGEQVSLQIKEEVLRDCQKIDARILKSFQKYRKWAPMGRREMAKEIDRTLTNYKKIHKDEFLFLYDKAYWLLSNTAHLNPFALDDFIKPAGNKLILREQPSKRHIANWLILSFHIFLRIVDKINDVHKIGAEEKIQDLESRFAKNFGR
ncbi:MAG TPA: hypothetical protein ENN38_04195 [Actinobacteria bacterium]|nr:hypothetical protein [Actinomycetota bacterium]